MDLQEWRKKFLLLQVNDALFPIGAYSHSYGLETYIQKNLLTSLDDVWEFCCSPFFLTSDYSGCLSQNYPI